ncbi:MAG: ABC transporter substrate-binding protein, partial [Pirellulales bacterium]|nr:ABC transporter substrate-binding protein [Pirellulales bacterium]
HLDPHASQLSTSWHIQHMIFDSLVTFDDEFNLQPSLASAWEWEGNNLTFTLRSGVKFANGREMTTDDVIGSLERAFVAKGNPWPLLLRNRTGMSASGNTVTIAFDGPNNVALASLAATLVCILPMKEVNEGTVDPTTDMYMASGPYRVVEHIANDRWVLEANPHYWGGQPKADKVVVRTIPSSQGLVAALREGSIDGAMFYGDPDASALLAGIPNVSYSILGTTDFAYLGLNALREDSPFTDKRVRQAVALVIDRQQIIDFALAGQSTPTYGWTQWGLTDDTKLPLYERNVEKAKALMAEAKPARTTLNMLVRGGNSVNEAVAQVIKQNLAEIGLDCQLESVDGGVWAKRVWGTRPVSDFDLTNSNYTGFSHPLITAHWWAPDLSGFTKGYVPVNETYTAALNKAVLGGGDEAAVNASLQELYGMLNEEAVKIPLCVVTDTIAWRSDRVNMTPSKKEEQNDVFSGVETWEMLT